jgi:hypothetical protein
VAFVPLIASDKPKAEPTSAPSPPPNATRSQPDRVYLKISDARPFNPFAPGITVEPPKSDLSIPMEELRQSLVDLKRTMAPKNEPPVSVDDVMRRLNEVQLKLSLMGTNSGKQ